MCLKSVPNKSDFTKLPDAKFGGSGIARAALAVAIAELNSGAQEIGGNNRGPWVKKYLNRLADEGSSWCAGFVSYCFLNSGCAMPFRYSVNARELFNQIRSLNWNYGLYENVTPEPGDIVFWWRNNPQSWQGHAGLVHHFADGFLYTIEGNRTPKVERFSYCLNQMTGLLGFARIPGSINIS